MANTLNEEQRLLCALLAASLRGGRLSDADAAKLASANRKKILDMAEAHQVLPLLYDVLCDGEFLSEDEKRRVDTVSQQTVRQSYRLLFLTRYLVNLLEQEKIPVVVLKGCGVSACYPVPELRKAGDVDLMVKKQDMERALALLQREGYELLEYQHANHHRVLSSAEGIDIELHLLPAEPFDEDAVNACMTSLAESFAGQIQRILCMDVELPVLSDAVQAIQLLLHMLQHFLRAGFGLRLLCDWVVFWNRPGMESAWTEFEALAEQCKVRGFADAVTESCVRFLGMSPVSAKNDADLMLAEEFLCDIFDAEEFGRSGAERMVAVRGTGVGAYIREFHYQMKMNHPRTSRYVILWPALWCVTLVVFLRNNRRLNRGSVSSIMRSAKKRGRLVRRMKLWEETDEKSES